MIWLTVWPMVAAAQIVDPVRVENGRLSGVRNTDGDPMVQVYRGIPYAAAPVGNLRWRPPQPPPSWDGVRTADAFGPGCIQHVAGSRLPWTKAFMHQGRVSEHCLYLNVWTAAPNAQAALPVFVFLHGGGFGEGSGSVAIYDGAQLARQGLVVVTINYRLGVFGFFAHPALTAESEHGASGNYGLLDQVAALQWIGKNIAAFGGDPTNVTIAGQSAGAISVYLLTASPLASGLFHRAIVESGPGGLASFGLATSASMAGSRSEAETNGTTFATGRGASSLDDLRAMSVADLISTAENGSPPPRFGPVIDGYFLPDDVSTIYAEGRQNDVPMLTGFNADEASAFPGYGTVKLEAFRRTARARYAQASDTFLSLYPAETDGEAVAAQQASQRDLAAVAMYRLAAERGRTGTAGSYLYYFERGIPWPEHPEFGAFHTGEVPYVFNNLGQLDRPWEAVDRRVAATVASYWVNFATWGNPNGDDLPAWPAYRDAPGAMMVLGEHSGIRDIPATDARRVFLNAQLQNE